MQLTDLLPDIGRLIAYSPALARALGSVNAAVLLCQLIYWLGKEAEPERGIYKTKAELTAETGLSKYEQDTATAKLKQVGLLTANYERLQHRMYYLLHTDALCEFWEKQQGRPPQESSFPESGKTAFPKAEKPVSRKLENLFPESGKTVFGKQEKPLSGNGKNHFRSLSIVAGFMDKLSSPQLGSKRKL